MQAEMIVTNAKVLTMDADPPAGRGGGAGGGAHPCGGIRAPR
jgi:hypothetical protein